MTSLDKDPKVPRLGTLRQPSQPNGTLNAILFNCVLFPHFVSKQIFYLVQVIVEDLRREFVSNYMLPAIQMGLVYEGRYFLGTSLARPCIAVGLVNAANKLGAK